MNNTNNNNTPTVFDIPVDDIQKSLKEAKAAALAKFNVSYYDMQKLYATDPEAFKAFVAEATLCSNKIKELYDAIIGSKNIFDAFNANFEKVLKTKLFETFDRVDFVKAEDGSVLYSLGTTVKTVKEVNVDALRDVCGVTVGATVVKCPELWSKGFVKTRYSKSKLLPYVEDAISKGLIPAISSNGVEVIKTTIVEETKIIYPGDTVIINQ